MSIQNYCADDATDILAGLGQAWQAEIKALHQYLPGNEVQVWGTDKQKPGLDCNRSTLEAFETGAIVATGSPRNLPGSGKFAMYTTSEPGHQLTPLR